MSCAGHIYPSTFTSKPNDSLQLSEGQFTAATKDLTTYIYFSTLQSKPLPSGQIPKKYFKSYQDYIASLKGRSPR
jgi:hypothetical protein